MRLEDGLLHFSGQIPQQSIKKIQEFYRLLVIGNDTQNLTRLISPEAFLQGHLLDCIEAEKSGMIGASAIDLGSGCGVPGLLMACIKPERRWILVESELHKAKFLLETVTALELSQQVQVIHERIETCLNSIRAETIVSRAVGSAVKILGWIGSSSTWNNLVLFKGPSWEKEETELATTKYAKKYKIADRYKYTSGEESKQRVLINIVCVPRGTR